MATIYAPSKRDQTRLEEVFINLNPMMDMFAVLIPALLMLSCAVEIALIDVAMSQNGPPPEEVPPPALELTVIIDDTGFKVLAVGGSGAPAEHGDPQAARVIALAEKSIVCSRYQGSCPPPRSRNRALAPCPTHEPLATRRFFVYDTAALTALVTALKDQFPTERTLILVPASATDYETIIATLDATRDVRQADGTLRTLFDEVVVRPPDAP
jgi:hypothetical protein